MVAISTTNNSSSMGGEFLLNKYLDWQRSTGKRGSMKEFATILGISRPYLSQLIAEDRKPSLVMQIRWAQMWGEEVFRVWGTEISDPDLRHVIETWGKLAPDKKKQIMKLLEN